jgi:hypothetical protein
MSYAIIRNAKYTKGETGRAYVHNERKTKNHTNKDIDPTRTDLNFYIKKSNGTYIQEFNRIKKEYDLKGQIKVTSNITCEMLVTSDKEFFDKIGLNETKRYFQEAYNCIAEYKRLGKENIVSAVVHLDELTPHMHLIYIPVVHTQDKEGNPINKLSCRDFWRGQNSYRTLQDTFFKHMKSKGFDLERGLASEITGAENLKIEALKQVTNYHNTEKILQETLEFPQTQDLSEINKFMINRDEKIREKIIKPRDELIQKLFSENLTYRTELSKKANILDKAEKYEKEYTSLTAKTQELEQKCSNLENEFDTKVAEVETKYTKQINDLQINFSNQTHKLKSDYENEIYAIEHKAKKKINELEKENRGLRRIIETFKFTIDKVFNWVAEKFVSKDKVEDLKADFEYDTYTSLDPQRQLDRLDRQKDDYDMEM